MYFHQTEHEWISILVESHALGSLSVATWFISHSRPVFTVLIFNALPVVSTNFHSFALHKHIFVF